MENLNKQRITGSLSGLLKTGFFHIFGASTINKVITALVSIILVRILSKTDFGMYAYVANIASFFILFNGLGAASAVLQLCSEKHDSPRMMQAIYRFAIKAGCIADVVFCIAIVAFALFAPLTIPDSGRLLLLYCLYPLLIFVCDVQLVWLRVNLQNVVYARMTNIQTLLISICSIGGALLLQSAGLIIGQSLAYGISFVALRFSTKAVLPAQEQDNDDPSSWVKDYWSIALVSSLNNGLGQALTLIGTFAVGALLASETLLAEFKVATTIPYALAFIPAAIMTYCYPYFARNRDNQAWTIRNYVRLMMGSMLFNGVLTVVFAVFAVQIICFIFGDAYEPASRTFQILMIGYFINATFRVPVGNLLTTQRKLTYNTFVSVVSIASIVVFNNWLIPIYGIEGAALAYSTTILIGALLNNAYYVHTIMHIARRHK